MFLFELENREVRINKCLVTGASGFLGRALCQTLQEQGHRVDVVGRNPGDLQYGGCQWLVDLSSELIPLEALDDVDTVFYLAGIAHASRSAPLPDKLYLQVNYKAPVDLLKKSQAQGVKRFVYISSVKAEFNRSDIEAADIYSKSKYLAEQAMLDAAKKSTDIHIVIIRPCLIYGDGVRGNLYSMLKWIDRGWFPPLPRNTGKRSMISREDVVSAILCVAENNKAHGGYYILADREPMCARELQDEFRSALGLRPLNWHVPLMFFKLLSLLGDFTEKVTGRVMPVNGEVVNKIFSSEYYSSEKINRELGWVAQYTFSDRVAGLVTDYLADPSSFH